MLSSTLVKSLTLGTLGAVFLTAPKGLAASMYSISDLGILPGYSNSIAYDINNNGQVVGTAYNSQGSFRAFLWDNGTNLNLGTLPNYSATSSAYSINDNGQVVGDLTDRVPSRAGYNTNAFVWENGVMKSLGTLGGSLSGAKAINNQGQVVGAANNTNGQERAYRTAVNSPINTATSDLGIDSTNGYSGATDINNFGEVVGNVSSGTNTAFVWKNGIKTQLEGFSGANAINDKGQIVGTPAAGNESAGVMWNNGVTIDLGTFGGSGSASDINNNAQIVGKASTQKGYRAYFWENGVLSDLNNLIPANSGWELTNATAINNRGQIVGDGTINGQYRAYLLTPLTPLTTTAPVPEPNYTFAILLIRGCGAFYLSKRKRYKLKI